MYIAIENELGKINLNGGVWRICGIEGLGLCDRTVNAVTYEGMDGQELVSSKVNARIITVSGDILRRNKPDFETERAIKILNKPCVLKIQAGSKQRKIPVRCSLFSAEPSDRNAVYQPFVLQLTADCPYFEDFNEKKIPLFLREDLINGSFTLPCVFTKRVSRVNVINAGDAYVRPKVFIVCEEEGTDSESYGIEITNHTTNQKFTLLYRMSKGEEICIDFENRTVKSSRKDEEESGGNLIGYMADDSFLSEFYLAPGVNDTETLSLDAECSITAFSEFSNKYIEAVI